MKISVMILCLMVGAGDAWGDTWDGVIPSTKPATLTGSGTVGNPYLITCAADFAWFVQQGKSGNLVNGKTYGNKYWKLTENIDLGSNESSPKNWATLCQSNSSSFIHFDGQNHTISNVKIDITTNTYYGLFINVQGPSATNKADVKNLNINGITFTTTKSLGGSTRFGALTAQLKYADVENVNVTDITYNMEYATTGQHMLGGLVSYMDACTTVKNCTVTNYTVNCKSDVNNLYTGGITAYTNSNTTAQTLMQGCTVVNPTITINGTINNSFVGCLAGQVNTYTDIKNNKVTNPSITLKGDLVSNISYVSAGVATVASNCNSVDGLLISGGTIKDEASAKLNVANNKEFFIGGAIGCLKPGGTAANQQNMARNLAVDGLKINLPHYNAVSGVINAHKYVVGGVIGVVSTPTIDATNRCSVPENLVSKDVTLYAPFAVTSPLVGSTASGLNIENFTIDARGGIDDWQKSGAGTWLYSGYKLGLSPDVLSTTGKIKNYGTATGAANGNVTRNYDPATELETIDGVSYLAITDQTFKHKNCLYDFEYDGGTVLWWTRTDNNANFKNDEIEQTVYPQVNNGSSDNLTGTYSYWMYYFQGVNNGKYVADLSAAVNGIEANYTQAKAATPVTLTISDPDGEAKKRGFDAHTITVTPSVEDTYTYNWYVDGVETTEGVTDNVLSVRPDWRRGKDIVVNALDGSSNVVASASYTLKHGVLKTKNYAHTSTDYIGMPAASRGTADNPYIIDCPEALKQWSYLSTYANNYFWEGLEKLSADGKSAQHPFMHYNRAYYELGADIDLGIGATPEERKATPGDFIPISHAGSYADANKGTINQNYIFCGHFDGKGHAVKNFKITWRGGQYNSNGSHIYFGFFGALGWGKTESSTQCVVQNLILENARLVHDNTNRTFYYSGGFSDYQNTAKTNVNHVHLGILAGIVSRYTTIQNVELRDCSIDDKDDTQEYDLSTGNLSVGGFAGRVMGAFNSGGVDHANSINFRFLSSNCDITLTHAKYNDNSASSQRRTFTVGGIVGSIYNSATGLATINMPEYVYYTGKINSRNAIVGPVFAMIDYLNNAGNNYSDYWKHYMAKTSTANQSFPNMYFGDYQIYDYTSGQEKYQSITNTYPEMGCNDGSRTITAHANSNHPNDYTFYSDSYYGEYQGVNYGEYIETSAEQTALEARFDEAKDGMSEINSFFLVFGTGADAHRLMLLDHKTMKVSLLDTDADDETATTHTLKVSNTYGDEGFEYDWFVNGVKVETEVSSSHDFDLGGTPQLVYVNVYDITGERTLKATTEIVDIPRTNSELTATYSPMRITDLGTSGLSAFNGFTVTPDPAMSATNDMSYEWREWIDATTGTYTAEDAFNINKPYIKSVTRKSDSHVLTVDEYTKDIYENSGNYTIVYEQISVTSNLSADEYNALSDAEKAKYTYDSDLEVWAKTELTEYVPVEVGADKSVPGHWGEPLSDFANPTGSISQTVSTANTSKSYQCSVTATDNAWKTFLTGVETDTSSPYYANIATYKTKYSTTMSCDVTVRLLYQKVIYLHPNTKNDGFAAGSDDNDGLTPNTPVKTWKKAYSLLDGGEGATWDFNNIVLMGTYTSPAKNARKDSSGNDLDRGLSPLGTYDTSLCEGSTSTFENWKSDVESYGLSKNTTITGMWPDAEGNMVDYKGIYEVQNQSWLALFGDTRFKCMTFKNLSTNYDVLFCQYHSLEMGDSLRMLNFNQANNYGQVGGCASPGLQIFGGYNSDGRFMGNPLRHEDFESTLPKGGFKINIKSGFYSVICVGGRQAGNNLNGIMGTPRVPIKCKVTVDIDQVWNKEQLDKTGNDNKIVKNYDNYKTVSGVTYRNVPYDITLIMAGNHEGAQYGDVDIEVRSGRVGRLVNGSLGAIRAFEFSYNGTKYRYPMNSFMGRSSIVVDPSKSRFKDNIPTFLKSSDKELIDLNDLVLVTEIYGGGLGRSHNTMGMICMPYYGHNSVTFNGGTMGIPMGVSKTNIITGIFGGGAGGVNGIGISDEINSENLSDANNAETPNRNNQFPYWATNESVGVVLYGGWSAYKSGNKVKVTPHDDNGNELEKIDLQYAKSVVNINGGVFGSAAEPIMGVFGAGSGFASLDFLTNNAGSYPNPKAGYMYGKPGEVCATVNIGGNTVIYGNVYGAGRGTDHYYKTERKWQTTKDGNITGEGVSGTYSDYTALAQTYGNVETNISGDAKIYGNVYGAGAGVAEAQLAVYSKKYNTAGTPGDYAPLKETAFLTGNATVNITDNAQILTFTSKVNNTNTTLGGNVYGGGMLAGVKGNTFVNISGSAHIDGTAFAAAQGIDNTESVTTYNEGTTTGAAETTYVGINNGNVKTTTSKSVMPGTNATYLLHTADNAKLFGIVTGNTNLTISGSPTIGSDIYGGAESAITDGNTSVSVNGGTIKNVFGGGLGSLNEDGTAIKASADVKGNTTVSINNAAYPAEDTNLYYVYGGGNLASTIGTYDGGELISGGATTVNISTGIATDRTTVYGGGFGAKTSCAATNVNIYKFPDNDPEDTNIYGLREVYGGGNAGPVKTKSIVNFYGGLVLGNVFGGGNAATVGTALAGKGAEESNDAFNERVASWASTNGTEISMVKQEDANATIYGNIFGGGNLAPVYGNASVAISSGTFAGEVFGGGNGLLNANNTVQTSADVTGNTSVYVNGATVIWDKLWDRPVNELNAGKTAIENAGGLITWGSNQENKEYFLREETGKVPVFLNSHNIYGGGNKACKIGTYYTGDDDKESIAKGTGSSQVDINKGFCDKTLLSTQTWRDSFKDNANPHFYVFGGGYGAYTNVGSTYVNVGVNMESNVETAETDEQLAPSRKASGDPETNIHVYDNNYGIPGYTVLGVVGGGYAGLVKENTEINFGGDTYAHRIFGGGYGQLQAYNDIITPDATLAAKLGEVGGSTTVNVNGGSIFGDIFGGGAGVESTTINEELTDFEDMGRVHGRTAVTISGTAKVFGNVYGGGDVANVGVAPQQAESDVQKAERYGRRPVSQSTFDAEGNITGYTADDAHNVVSFLNIIGGDIYGKLFAGGNGRKKAEAKDYTKLGRIEGNTLLHIAESKPEVSFTQVEGDGTIVPTIWNRIYGGCSFGTVDGNTLVHIEGGRFGHNIFGGGFGDVQTSVLDEVLGMKDGTGEASYATYANVLGNTKVQIDGGSWIWDRYSDDYGNITIWKDASKKIANTTKEVQSLLIQGRDSVFNIIKDVDTDFYKPLEHSFRINHNIFGGGNRACMVGTYPSNDSSSDAPPATNTGLSEVVLNHSLITKVEDANGKIINLLDPLTLAGLCWFHAIDNTAHPQFAVFGAGYGVNTKVGNTRVYAGPGIQIKADASGMIPEGEGGKPRYAGQVKDMEAYSEFESDIFNTFNNPNEVTEQDLKMYYGSLTGNRTDDVRTFLRYRASRIAWSMGCPNFTFMDIHGGGFSGYVQGNCDVTADCQLAVRNLFGGGLGSKPVAGKIGSVDHTIEGTETYGQVGGNTSVKIYGGNVSLNVYGGGAGVESFKKTAVAEGYTDFPDIARVKGKSSVEVWGEAIHRKMGDNTYDVERVLIFGSVYGGGDVANVGSTAAVSSELNAESNEFTTSVGVYGASILSAVYAGGNGRKASECRDYTKLGGVYGNTRLYVENTTKAYPYYKWGTDTETSTLSSAVIPYLWNIGYGGGQNGTVFGNTLVHLNGGYYADNIFGGGYGDVTGASITSADVTGNTNVLINGGEAKLTSMWKPSTRTWTAATEYNGVKYSPQYDPVAKKFLVNHNVYGGGNVACDVKGNTYIHMNKGMLDNKQEIVSAQQKPADYDFFKTQQWKEVYNKVGSPHFCVFGGGYGEHAIVSENTNVNVALASQDGHTIANAPRDVDTDDLYSHFFSKQSVMDIVGGGYSGKVVGSTNVTVGSQDGETGETFCRRVFGGGFYASVGSSNVNINRIDCSDVFGGGLMGDVGEEDKVQFKEGSDANGVVSLNIGSSGKENTSIWIHKNVYGGNDVSGNVYKSTNITAYGGHILGNLYGAGNGNYLYAQGSKSQSKIEVNESYQKGENIYPLVYTVPARPFMSSVKNASAAQRMVNINSWMPQVQSVNINLKGLSKEHPFTVGGGVFGGGNAATVAEITKGQKPTVRFKFGRHIDLNYLYMGCDGEAMFDTLRNFVDDFQYINNIDLTESVNWTNDPGNVAITQQYLPVAPENRPKIYPHLLDLYFQPVEMSIQPTIEWESGLIDGSTSAADADIRFGSFVCGGNRGNMNVEPSTATGEENGQFFNYTFPSFLTISDKIVGGCNNANYFMRGVTKIHHEGGYLLGVRNKKAIKLNVNCKFDAGDPTTTDGVRTYASRCNVYGGCYKSGRIAGDVYINMQSNMMDGLDSLAVANSNDQSIALCNVYGAGYGTDSYVYGNTIIDFGDASKAATIGLSTQHEGKYSVTNAASCNYIFGGGQQGYLIGNSNIHIKNGRLTASVCGGSYAGYQYGSTNVQIGYPESYTCKESGVYKLSRKDIWNADEVNTDGNKQTKVIKDEVCLLRGDVISKTLLDAITKFESTDISSSNQSTYFTTNSASATDWSKINIKIDRAVYGGGYSLASGSSVKANSATVCKFDDTEKDNGKDFTVDDDFPYELPNGTSVGFGGNTSVIIKDYGSDKDHITISSPVFTKTNLKEGQDLFGLYYLNNTGTLIYVSEEDTYFNTDGKRPSDAPQGAEFYAIVMSITGEGGVYGDGHLSYSEGFRTCELQNYGYASYTPLSAKLINTFQRFDIMRVHDCCVSLLGDRDYASNGEVNTTPYSLSRVGELQMISSIDNTGTYTPLTTTGESNSISSNFDKRTRNYIGLSNNIKYVGAIWSNDNFTDKWHSDTGVPHANKTYQSNKQDYITNYCSEAKNELEFRQRNNGTARNMIGIASGYALKIQNVKSNATSETHFWGPICGVVEINLISVRKDEGAGYIYADNLHAKSSADSTPDGGEGNHTALEASGNFVFAQKTSDFRYIVDDCFPKGFEKESGYLKPESSDALDPAHYWYVTGLKYYYNAHITGYSFNSSSKEIEFRMDNTDDLMILSGAKAGAAITLESVKWESEHPSTGYSCDLENRNQNSESNVHNAYTLKLSACNSSTYKNEGAYGVIPFTTSSASSLLAGTINKDEAPIAISLYDKADNAGVQYYQEHLSKPCFGTIVLSSEYTKVSAPSAENLSSYFVRNGDSFSSATEEFDSSTEYYEKGSVKFTYTIYLTIQYVQGPNATGSLKVHNCALPGEMIKIDKGDIKIESDQGLFQTATYWRVGPRNKVGEQYEFKENVPYATDHQDGYFTYDLANPDTNSMLSDVEYDQDDDYILLPAYYFMNGYGVQYVFKVNGIDAEFPVPMTTANQLTIHNYHRMMPRSSAGNADPKDLHIDMAAQRHKRELDAANAMADGDDKTAALKAVLPEPRIYIVDDVDLKAFAEHLPSSNASKVHILGASSNNGANMQFFLQYNITAPNSYTAPADFKGIFHGDGHVISGLANKNFLTKNSGQVYNLGLVAGNIAGSSAEQSKLHCCYEYAGNKVYRMNGTEVSTYTDFDWRYGKVAYDLNEFYLDTLHSKASGTSGTSNYVEDYYANGDYLYANYSSSTHYPNSEFLRTSSRPNYGQQKSNHNSAHPIDKSRAVSYQAATAEAKESCTGYQPLLDATSITSSVISDASLIKNDFLFFGQLQNSSTKTSTLGTLNVTLPTLIASSLQDDQAYHLVSSMSNRLYRAGGYYGDATNQGFYYNQNAYIHDNGITAIDFHGYTPHTHYGAVHEDVLNLLTKDANVTRNLLIYASANINRAGKLSPFTYDASTSERYINAHIIDQAETPTTPYLHLVERTSSNRDAANEQCLNNDFHCPISFHVTNRAWYTRKPSYYSESTNDAWEGICLPFTVNKAVASLNGEITHFYGSVSGDASPENNHHTLHHEYWLRGLTSVSTTSGTTQATFQRPGSTLFDPQGGSPVSSLQSSLPLTFSNAWLPTTYADKDYNSSTNAWYASDHTYSDYLPLTSNIPYIMSLPGNRYYEFDLSSRFYNEKFTQEEPAQTVTFNAYGPESGVVNASEENILIPVTTLHSTEAEASSLTVSHLGTYKALTDASCLTMNSTGTAFTFATGSVLPFRTYMTATSNEAQTRSVLDDTSIIYIAGESTSIDEVSEPLNPDSSDSDSADYLRIYPSDYGRLTISSTYATLLEVYTLSGQLYRLLDVRPGTATYSGFPPAIYIIGNCKVRVR